MMAMEQVPMGRPMGTPSGSQMLGGSEFRLRGPLSRLSVYTMANVSYSASAAVMMAME